MQDCIGCLDRSLTLIGIRPGVWVGIEARAIATGYFNTQAVTREENIAGGAGIHGYLVDLSRL